MGIMVYDDHGKSYFLNGQNWSGGEGTVYKISDQFCVKVYNKKSLLNQELHFKLLAMIKNPPEDITLKSLGRHSFAWPLSLIYYDSFKKQFAGFIMPYINRDEFTEAHKYFTSSERLQMFKNGCFSWEYLSTVAFNLASVVDAIHEKGHCIGDLRDRNICVSRQASIAIIDCDSFQIKDSFYGKSYYSRVGTGEYLPPELQYANFNSNNIDRYHSDLFGLSILIFKFLLLGTHPYQARGQAVNDAPSIEKKITKGLYPYSSKYASLVSPPAHAVPFDIIPSSIRNLFYKCFVDGHSDKFRRPTAYEWAQILSSEIDNLKQCNLKSHHVYSGHLKYCPWCRLIQDKGKEYFPDEVGT